MAQSYVKQHYVPKLLLRNFQYTQTNNKKRAKIFSFNKKLMSIEKIYVSNAAQQEYFYSDDDEIEKVFDQEIESKASPIITRLIKDTNQINLLTDIECLQLKLFFCIQLLRTDKMRDAISDIVNQIQKDVEVGSNKKIRLDKAEDFRQAVIETGTNIDPYDNLVRRQFGNIMLRQAAGILPHFLKRNLFLFHSRNNNLYISDNPVTTQNLKLNLPYAIKEPETLIFLPLSPKLCLCAAYNQMFIKHLIQFNGSRKIYINKKVATQLNTHQIKFSKTYLFSNEGCFRLAKELLTEKPNLKDGYSFKVLFDD